jgi:integrase
MARSDTRFLALCRILYNAGLRINPAVATNVAECPILPAVTDSDGLPICWILMEDSGPGMTSQLQVSARVLLCGTDEDLNRITANPSDAVTEASLPKSSPARWMIAFGEPRTMLHWSQDSRCVVSYKALMRRMEHGWGLEKAMTTPARQNNLQNTGRLLYRHASGQWAKRINGHTFYFGAGSYEEALAAYSVERRPIELGRVDERDKNPTIEDLADKFVAAKAGEMSRGEINRRTYEDYLAILKRMLKIVGSDLRASDMTPEVFLQLHQKLSDGVSPTTIGNHVRRLLVWVNWVNAHDLLASDIKPGPSFRPPSKTVLRKSAQERDRVRGLRMLEPADCRTLYQAAPQILKAMVLLGLNCGMGNTDCANLREPHLDLKAGWMDFPRPKTAIERRAKLWPETVDAIRLALSLRPQARSPENSDLVFVTKYGNPWVKKNDDAISKEFSKVLKDAGLKRDGINFYSLRHTFQTFSEEHEDATATKLVMGHADSSMSAVYRRRFPSERLERLSEFLRTRLDLFRKE